MSGSVYGNVVLKGTGEPVAGATVVCGKGGASKTARSQLPAMSALTDSAGWFRFENLAAGEWHRSIVICRPRDARQPAGGA